MLKATSLFLRNLCDGLLGRGQDGRIRKALMLSPLIFRIRNRQSGFYLFLNKAIKYLLHANFPSIKPLYGFLWWERNVRLGLWRWLLAALYYIPMFKARCTHAGKNIQVINGIPDINENIKIIVGDNVIIYGTSGFQGYKVYPEPMLEIGNDSYIGPQVRIGVGERITIRFSLSDCCSHIYF